MRSEPGPAHTPPSPSPRPCGPPDPPGDSGLWARCCPAASSPSDYPHRPLCPGRSRRAWGPGSQLGHAGGRGQATLRDPCPARPTASPCEPGAQVVKGAVSPAPSSAVLEDESCLLAATGALSDPRKGGGQQAPPPQSWEAPGGGLGTWRCMWGLLQQETQAPDSTWTGRGQAGPGLDGVERGLGAQGGWRRAGRLVCRPRPCRGLSTSSLAPRAHSGAWAPRPGRAGGTRPEGGKGLRAERGQGESAEAQGRPPVLGRGDIGGWGCAP